MRKSKNPLHIGDTNEYGYATVISLNEGKDRWNNTLIRCRCKCGNEFTTTISKWNQQKGTSCGCMLGQKRGGGKPIPLGRLGHLTIIESGLSRPSGQHYARCICDCNPDKVIEIPECDLRKNTRSCGCRGRVPNGAVFGRLTVIDNSLERNGHSMALVRCSCDKHKEFEVDQHYLKRGNVKSCGCLHYDNVTKHGESHSRLYRIWVGMRDRCHNRNAAYSKWYVEKGISVCNEWRDYFVFKKWAMENGYSKELTLDRIDSNGNYCPENCRWASRKMQSNNKADNVILEYNGEKHNISEWADILKIPVTRIRSRHRAGWSTKDIFTTEGKKTRGWRERERQMELTL